MKKIFLERICQHFQLGKLKYWKTLTGGSLHFLWNIKTEKGKFVIKQLNSLSKKTLQHFKITQKIAKIFSQNGVPAIFALSINNDIFYQIEKLNYLAFPYCSGKNCFPDSLSISQVKKIGSLLANMHQLKLNITDAPKTEQYTLTDKNWQNPFLNQKQKGLVSFLHKKCLLAKPPNSKKLIVSHRDLTPQNVIWKNPTAPYLIDWEYAGFIHPSVELLSSALNWSINKEYKLLKHLFDSLIESYRSIGTIDDLQNPEIFYQVIKIWMSWLAFNLNRLDDPRSVKEINHTLNCLEAVMSISKAWS